MLPLQLLNVIGIIVMLYFVIDLFASDEADTSATRLGSLAAGRGPGAFSGPETPRYHPVDRSVVPGHLCSETDLGSLQFMWEKGILVRDFYRDMAARWREDFFIALVEDENRHLETLSKLMPGHLQSIDSIDPADGQRRVSWLKSIFPKIAMRGERSIEDAIVAGVMFQMWALSDVIEMEELTCTDELRNLLHGFKQQCCNQIRVLKDHLAVAA